jgi:RNA polymerase sigma factor (sigma-70 family)
MRGTMSTENTPPDDLADLLKRVQEGDEAALASLVEHYASTLRRVARASLGEPMRAHLDSIDLVQSVHRLLLVGLRNNKFEFRDHAQLLGLALTLVRRRVARHWRQMKNEPGTATHMALGSDEGGEHEPAAKANGDPVDQLAVNEQFDRLLDTLDPLDRRVLELRMEGLSTADVARELGVEAAMLRVRLGRLRQKLRDSGLFNEWM